jgi:transcriptional regulator with XRE-family HTH domain
MAKKWDNLKAKMSPEAQARVDARVQETLASMPLAEIRKAIGLTQAQLAETLEMGQGSISKIENATDMYLSTLRRFVAALGGNLVIKASFPEGREIVIDHLSTTTEPSESPQPRKRSA